MKKLKSLYEKAAAYFADNYGQSLGKFLDIPSRVLRFFLVYIVPFIIGAKASGVVTDLPVNSSFFSLATWRTIFLDNWILLPLLIFYLIGVFWRNKIDYKNTKIHTIRDALTWIYHDLNFDGEKYAAADIRMTIWVPVRKNQKLESFRMQQLVDYVPTVSQKSTPSGGFRKNKTAGRVFRFTRPGKDEILGIGIAGLCVIAFESKHEPKVHQEMIPATVKFSDYMVSNWHFTPAQAELLTSDRRSYLCGPLMDRSAKALYGIIYIDSSDPKALTKVIANKFEKNYLTRIADLFAA